MKTFPVANRTANWLRDSLIQPALMAKTIVRQLKKINIKFDSIAVQGYSCTVISSAVAALMNKEIIVVRKKGEKRHSGAEVEGVVQGKKYIIIDDFVSTGATVRRIIDMVGADGGEFVGLFTYQSIYNTVPEGLEDYVKKEQLLTRRAYVLKPYIEVPDGTLIYSGGFKNGNGAYIPQPKSDSIIHDSYFLKRGDESKSYAEEMSVWVEIRQRRVKAVNPLPV